MQKRLVIQLFEKDRDSKKCRISPTTHKPDVAMFYLKPIVGGDGTVVGAVLVTSRKF